MTFASCQAAAHTLCHVATPQSKPPSLVSAHVLRVCMYSVEAAHKQGVIRLKLLPSLSAMMTVLLVLPRTLIFDWGEL